MKPLRTILREKQTGPFRIVEKSYTGSTSLASHQHQSAYLSFLLAGAYVEVSNRVETTCLAGTVIWHPASEVHSDRFHLQGGRIIDLEVRDSWLRDAAQSLQPVDQTRMFCGGLPYALGLQAYRGLGSDDGGLGDVVTELLSFFFSGGVDRHPSAWFGRALQLLNDSDGRHQSLSSVAREVGVHPVHLARSFRRFAGCTFGDYQLKTRVRRAFELLLHDDRPIVDVAYACGFADHAHLSRTFRKCTGLSPSSFRSVARQSH